jgi:histone-lysine N-methyltransferase MLL2
MTDGNVHQELVHASEQILAAKQAVLEAQGSDPQLLEQAQQQLIVAEQVLQIAQNKGGTVATENPQFQQAYEQLHDTRQQVQEATQNNNDIL